MPGVRLPAVYIFHIGFFRAEKVDPDIEVAEKGTCNPGQGGKRQGRDPKTKEAERVHGVTRKPEDALFHQGTGAVAGIKVIQTKGPQKSEIFFHGIEEIQRGDGNDRCQAKRDYRGKGDGTPVGPGQKDHQHRAESNQQGKAYGIDLESTVTKPPGEHTVVEFHPPAEPDIDLMGHGVCNQENKPCPRGDAPQGTPEDALGAAEGNDPAEQKQERDEMQELPFKYLF